MSQLYWWRKQPSNCRSLEQDSGPPSKSSVKLVTFKSTPHGEDTCGMWAERARPSFTIRPVGMLATAMDRWTRLKSVAALMCICRAARGCYLGAGAGPTVCVCATHTGALCGCAACEARWSLERGGRGRHAPQVADTTAAHRRVCVIAGLSVSGMPASTGRREQSVCFFAGGRAGARVGWGTRGYRIKRILIVGGAGAGPRP